MPFSTCCRLIAGLVLLLQPLLVFPQSQPKPTPQDTIRLLAEEEQRRLADPATGTVPYERLDAARQQLNNRPATANGAPVAQSGIPNVSWQERGPSNIGGRTRALLFDPNDPTHKKVWAGSLAGGLWYTNDITDANAGWTPVSDAWENTVVTALAADPSNPQVMYAGTGDIYNYVQGGGIWKTTDGGANWTRLSSTIPGGNPPAISYSFGYIQRIVVTSSGQLFAATRLGVVRSTDGGTTWQYVLAPNQGIGAGTNTNNYYNDLITDLELASDGILYAGLNPSRVFRSTDVRGGTWTEITPANAGGERTELALVPSTSGASQVIYGVSRGYNNVNYGQDVKWFKRSINGGATWIDIPIPTFSWGDHFTAGNGYNSLNLVVHPTDANTVYAGGYDWFRSTDGGASWGSTFANQYQYQQGLWFQPGSGTNVALATNYGILWSTDWGNNAVVTSTLNSRSNGYRVAEVSSVSMKPGAGSSFLLAGVRPVGYVQMTSPGLSTGNPIWSITYPGVTFIDDDDPTIQIIQHGNILLRYSSPNAMLLTSANSYYSTIAADYDSPSNTLYVGDNVNNQSFIRKITNVGTTPTSTTLSLAGVTNLASSLKLNSDRSKLFIGTGSGQLYRVSNLDLSAPSVTAIDNGALPQAYISSIDVGANEDELLVTFTNYGIQSVWYTNNGGTTWTGKDQTGFGLPDVPVRSALFNPQNRKQVLLATDAGIWSTTDVTSANPGWAFSGTGMGGFQVNQLRYRASDGRMTVATNGRGIFTSDAFAIPYTLPTVSITSISNTTLCAGNTFSVSFTTAGPAFSAGNTFEVWLSDASGNFTNAQKIGSGNSSPISTLLPSGYYAVPYGANYRVKVLSTNPDVESSPSSALTIGNITYVSLNDRRVEVGSNYSNGFICSGSSARLVTTLSNGYTVSGDASYQWFLNNNPVAGATASTYIAQQTGNYTVTAKQGGCSITSYQYPLGIAYFYSGEILSATGSTPQCVDRPITVASDYIGETASFQWTRNGIAITGATSYSYTASLTGSYAVNITDGACDFNSSPTYFQFGQSLFANAYLNSPSDTLICTASNYGVYIRPTLPYLANGYSLQWYRNGVFLTEMNPATSNSSIYAYQPGIYSFILKQGTCQTTSNAINIVDALPLAVNINSNTNTRSFCPGESCYLYANLSNGSFQWQKDGLDIAGATSSGYTATGSGSYTVRIIQGSCSATSPPVSLTFSNAFQPRLLVNNFPQAACSSIVIVSDYYSINGYQYQWYKNAVPLTGSTNSYYYPGQSGNYSIRITNGSCTGLSKEVYVNVNNGQTAKPLINNPTKRQLCANNSLLLTANSYIGTLQWKRNGVVIPGATSNQFYATQSGLYSVVSQDGSCTAESDPFEVKIGEATTATLSGNALITAGQSTKIPIAFTGPAPWSFTLTNGQSLTAIYQNPAFIDVSPASNTTYQLASVINACGTGTISGQASVSVGTGSADVSLNMIVSNRSPNVGDVVSYTISALNAGPDNATGIQLSSLLPAGLAFVSSPSAGVSIANGLLNANLGTIPANGKNSISFLASPALPGIFATTAQITASQTPDPDSQPNSGTGDGQDDEASVDLRTTANGSLVSSSNPNQVPLPRVLANQPATDPNSADLSLSMKVDKVNATSTDVISTSLSISNRGGSSASSIVVQMVLPNGTALPASQSGWVLVSGQTYKGYLNQLAAGQSATLVLLWQPTGSGTLTAQILDVAEADPDSTPGNGFSKGEDDEATISVRVR